MGAWGCAAGPLSKYDHRPEGNWLTLAPHPFVWVAGCASEGLAETTGCCCYICRGPRRGLQGHFPVWKQMKSIWILLACPFRWTHLTLKRNLIFMYSQSSHCLHGLWFWLTRLQRARVFGLGDSGDKNVRLTTHLWSTSWGGPDTNITAPAAQHGLAYKQPAQQQVRYKANSCIVGSDAFFNTHLISRGKSQFGHRLSYRLVTLNIELANGSLKNDL